VVETSGRNKVDGHLKERVFAKGKYPELQRSLRL
jgi:hypothetical protein